MNPPLSENTKNKLGAVLVFIVTQVVYLFTLAPTITSEDSGELITAAVTLGVPHPPGYPLWTMLGKLISYLPSDSPAWPLNYLSALMASLTISVLFLTLRLCSVGLLISLCSSLAYGFSLRFWSQSIIAEVYTLNMLLVSLCIFFLMRWRLKGSQINLILSALSFCLSLANHYMLSLLIAPALFIYLLWSFDQPRNLARLKYIKVSTWPLKTLALCIVLLFVCLGIYAYLPWSALRDPAMNWGNPSNWERLIALVSRQQYKSLELSADISIGIKLIYMIYFAYLMLLQFTPFVLIPGLILTVYRGIGLRAERILLAGIIFLNGPVLLWILKFSFEAENRSRVEEYFLQAWYSLVILIALGLHKYLNNKPQALKIIIGLFLFTAPLLTHYKQNDLSKNYLAYDYNYEILNSLEKDAIYFPGGDYNSFPSVYLQAVEGIRPDVIIADITGDLSSPARKYIGSIYKSETEISMSQAQEIMLEQGTRPMYFTNKNDSRVIAKSKLEPWGLVYRARGDPESKKPTLILGEGIRNFEDSDELDDMGNSMMASLYVMQAEQEIIKNNIQQAILHYEKASQYSSSSKEGLNNLGATVAEKGLSQLAAKYFKMACDIYPGYLTARRNLARTLTGMGQKAEALVVYKELLSLEPNNSSLAELVKNLSEGSGVSSIHNENQNLESRLKSFLKEIKEGRESPAVWNNIGNVYSEMKVLDKALSAYHKAIELDPNYAKVYKNLALFYKNLKGDVKKYDELMKKYRSKL